MEFNSGFKGLI